VPRGRLTRIGFWFLNLTTRSWSGFWGTVAFCALYIGFNSLSRGHWVFDSYPFVALCVLLTVFSYFQNIVIMTMQRENEAIQESSEQADQAILSHIHDVVQALHTMMEVQLGHDAKIQKLLTSMNQDLEDIQKDLTEDQQ